VETRSRLTKTDMAVPMNIGWLLLGSGVVRLGLGSGVDEV
jgi:hypothetical protein